MKFIAVALLFILNCANITVNEKPHFLLGFCVRLVCVAGIIGLIK